ncbi:hypothetical protein BTJ39_19085 [Izhakiella australiensis]|uniref:Uncharacterized protein n=1 Tax=Izhakiella australiensis TaxID=1926881 RepID=A0A1S8YGH4_9GAMM|nr:hypothetical protein BTJ39_19085 [Izhakiella australiensis]
MPVIKLHCKECGCDRFRAATDSSQDDRVARMYCEKCALPVNIEDVVWYRDDYVAPGTLPREDSLPFNDGVYILPGA